MVKYRRDSLAALFAALADPTRRSMLARLARGPSTLTELAGFFPISLPAVLKHLRVLERAGLVRRSKCGRPRRCRLQPRALMDAAAWLAHFRPLWEAQLDASTRVVPGADEDTQT